MLGVSDLLTAGSVAAQARLLSKTLSGPGYWLVVAIPARQLRALLQFYSRLSIFPLSVDCPRCSSALDLVGDHAVSCTHSPGIMDRHTSVSGCLLCSSGPVSLCEPIDLLDG